MPDQRQTFALHSEIAMSKTGRNDPCPCGSGKKYKQCCMQLDRVQTAEVRPEEVSIPEAFQTALEHHRAGRLPQAEAIYLQILQIVPNHKDAIYLRALIAHQVGRHDLAVELLNKVINANPSNPDYYNQLGIVFKDQGKLDRAIVCYQKALSIKPDFAEAHNNLGNALTDHGELSEAVASYKMALLIKPNYVEAYSNIGTALQEQGKLDEAVANYQSALSLEPGHAGAHFNLGNARKSQGKLDEAIASYQKALSLNPDFAQAHDALGIVLLDQGRADEAATSCRKAVSLKPDHAAAHNNLGNALTVLGQVDAALASYQRALALEDAPEFKTNFARCIGGMDLLQVDADVLRLVIRSVSEAWARPGDLAKISSRLVLSDPNIVGCVERALGAWPTRLAGKELFGSSGPAVLANSQLLQSLLIRSPVVEFALEQFLTLVRHAILDAAVDAVVCGNAEEKTLSIYCALARQCFINDYIFSYTDEEFNRATLLREKLVAALGSGTAIPPLWPVAVAAYFPLSSLPSAGILLNQSWPASVTALLRQQIAEPLQEQQYRDAIPRLTTIEDSVSRRVRQQYEEHPYPKWIDPALARKGFSVDGYLRHQFPFKSFSPFSTGANINILVAGCGTGQESVDTARRFPGAHVLAVDLSLSSLCYAKRKTLELGLANVEYAQGDIMQLASIGRMFDAIVSVGVLHHLADPMAGWRQLLSILRPGGFMRLGFYSERARRSVVAARNFIAERGYDANAEDIRRCRQDLRSLNDGRDFSQLTGFGDFFATSECRDLLFHVEEHRFVLPQIKEMLGILDLDFIGFDLEPRVTKKYQERYPDDNSKTNLDYWHDFETEYPNTFLGMYQFWVQKPD
jgi:tetratricopeptide (TPR) repeat protein/SAM-dependent methyltransferase